MPQIKSVSKFERLFAVVCKTETLFRLNISTFYMKTEAVQTPVSHHRKWYEKLATPSICAALAALALSGCSLKQPRAEVVLGPDPDIQPVKIAAHAYARGQHFTYRDFSVEFGTAGDYLISNPRTSQSWRISVSHEMLGKPQTFALRNKVFLCERDFPQYFNVAFRQEGTRNLATGTAQLLGVPVNR